MKKVSGSASELVDQLVAGDRRVLARAISLAEDRRPEATEVIRLAFLRTAATPIVGVTGPSGAGKSTLVDALTSLYRQGGETIGILAVDPSSPFTGGALLGDRVRMQRHSEDAGVYMRSMATRGTLGGLAAAAYDAMTLLAAAGLDRLLVETIGVGQDEVDVAGVADTTCIVLTPASGDEVQAIKAGIMEVADVLVLNKSDMQGADRTEAVLRGWVSAASERGWRPPIVRTVAPEGVGLEELRDAVAAHEEWYRSSGQAETKRRSLAALRLRTLLRDRLLARARKLVFDEAREAELVEAIAAGELDPYSAAEEVVSRLLDGDAGREPSA